MSELIKIEEKNGEQLVSARELHEFLGVRSRFNDWIKNRIDKYEFVENQDFTTLTKNLAKGGRETDYIITLDMAKELCYRSKSSPKVKEALKQLGVDIEQIHTSTRFEISFVDMLEKALNEFGIKGVRQYVVGDYRIDFYIPDKNIAVEYDEQQHQYQIEKDKAREEYIERELGCKFVRCDYRVEDIINVMRVVKEVM